MRLHGIIVAIVCLFAGAPPRTSFAIPGTTSSAEVAQCKDGAVFPGYRFTRGGKEIYEFSMDVTSVAEMEDTDVVLLPDRQSMEQHLKTTLLRQTEEVHPGGTALLSHSFSGGQYRIVVDENVVFDSREENRGSSLNPLAGLEKHRFHAFVSPRGRIMREFQGTTLTWNSQEQDILPLFAFLFPAFPEVAQSAPGGDRRWVERVVTPIPVELTTPGDVVSDVEWRLQEAAGGGGSTESLRRLEARIRIGEETKRAEVELPTEIDGSGSVDMLFDSLAGAPREATLLLKLNVDTFVPYTGTDGQEHHNPSRMSIDVRISLKRM